LQWDKEGSQEKRVIGGGRIRAKTNRGNLKSRLREGGRPAQPEASRGERIDSHKKKIKSQGEKEEQV